MTLCCILQPGKMFISMHFRRERVEVSGHPGIRTFSRKKNCGIREQNPFPEENGNPGLKSGSWECVAMYYGNTGNCNYSRKKIPGIRDWTPTLSNDHVINCSMNCIQFTQRWSGMDEVPLRRAFASFRT